MFKSPSSAVNIEVSGGIGNQLFMYLGGLALSLNLDVELNVFRSMNDKARFLHSGDIADFSISANLIPFQERSYIQTQLRRVEHKITRKPNFDNDFMLRNFKYFEAHNIGFDSRLHKLSCGVTIKGYFQSYRYYEECKKFLSREEIFSLKHPSISHLEMKRVIDKKKSCAIHVRRGDYVNHVDSIGILSRQYYVDAINLLNKVANVELFVVFSDDSTYSRELLEPILPFDTIWADELSGLSSSEQLILMSDFQALIIANSSFSLLAAIHSLEDTIVIRPTKWFIGQADPLELSRPGWISVDR